MKKYIIALLAAASVCVSCSDLDSLTVPPRGEMSNPELEYTDPGIRLQILAGVYSPLYKEELWGSGLSIRYESATDISLSRLVKSGATENNTHTETSQWVTNSWFYLYQGINAANEFIKNAREIAPVNALTGHEISEARLLRAFYYFTLVRLWGDVPFRTEPLDNVNNTDIARTNAVDIYKFIVEELKDIQITKPEEGKYGLENFGGRNAKTGHVNLATAQMLLADVYLNMAGFMMDGRIDTPKEELYKGVEEMCNAVINSGVYDINANSYSKVFLNAVQRIDSPKEVIWEIRTDKLRPQGILIENRIGKYNGIGPRVKAVYGSYNFIFQTCNFRDLYGKISKDDIEAENTTDSYAVKGKDDRADWNARHMIVDAKSKYMNPVWKARKDLFNYYPGKFPTIYAPTPEECADMNFSGTRLAMYRIAEAHLFLAEALNELGRQSEAVAQVNIVRKRAHATEASAADYTTKEQVFNLIVDERARELCFEGKRRFDLIRWNIYGEKMGFAPDGSKIEGGLWDLYTKAELKDKEENAGKNKISEKMVVFSNFDLKKHYILPIPETETSRNPLIPPTDQNEGWGGNHKWHYSSNPVK